MNDENEHDEVSNPAHYNAHPSGIECIQITEHMNFNLGNAIKYIWRNGLKEGTSCETDLRKAIWYIEREIKRLNMKSSIASNTIESAGVSDQIDDDKTTVESIKSFDIESMARDLNSDYCFSKRCIPWFRYRREFSILPINGAVRVIYADSSNMSSDGRFLPTGLVSIRSVDWDRVGFFSLAGHRLDKYLTND